MDYSKITDDLFIGTTPTVPDYEHLRELGVRLVINMRWEFRPPPDSFEPPLRFLWQRTFDSPLIPIPMWALHRGAQAALEAVHDEQDFLCLHGFEQFIYLWALSLWDFEFEVFESFFGEVLKTRVAFIERPPDEFPPFGRVNMCVNPLPGEGALAKSAQGAEDEEAVFVLREPAIEHFEFR